jgi:hypothetical protein
MSSENDAKAKALEEKLAEVDLKSEVAGKVFDPKLLFERANRLKTVDDPVLGKLQYGELTFEDSFVFGPVADPNERTLTIVHLMLKKAYPDITLDMVRRMPLAEANAFMAIVSAQPCFLPQTSQRGSAITVKRRK